MPTVDSETYKIPERYGTLADSYRLKELTEPGRFNDLPQLALGLNFQKVVDYFPTRRSGWQVFDRQNHDVPNFPDGATRVNSVLAVYGKEGNSTHAVLRTSKEPHSLVESLSDLEAFTKHYIERPSLLGLPSKGLTGLKVVFGSLALGIVAVDAAGYYISGEVFNLGALAGEAAGATFGGGLWAFSEMRGRRSISDLGQYTAGDGAKHTLLGERYHCVQVDIQRELYAELLQQYPDLTPDRFLDKIYGQIPKALVNRRHAEVEQAKYARADDQKITGNSLPQLIGVSRTLQSIEAYLKMANGLQQQLAS